MSAPSANNPNDIGGGWFDAPGMDAGTFDDPLAGIDDMAAPPQDNYRDFSNSDWDEAAKSFAPLHNRTRPNRLVPASTVQRFFGFILDNIAIAIATFLLAGLVITLGPWEVTETSVGLAIAVVQLCVVAAYYAGFESMFGATPAKALLGLKVVSSDGQNIAFNQSLIRNFWRIVSTIVSIGVSNDSFGLWGFVLGILPFLLALSIGLTINASTKGEGWHDAMAGARVVLRRGW